MSYAAQVKLAAVCVASVGVGIATNRVGMTAGPQIVSPKLFSGSPLLLRKFIGLPARWGGSLADNGLSNFLLLLVAFFKDIMDAPNGSGRALTALVLSIWAPLALWQTIESVKYGQSRILNPASVVLLYLAGQAGMIGAVIPALFVPLYAIILYRRKQSSKPTSLPSLSARQTNLIQLIHLFAAAFIAPTLLLPTSNAQVYAIGNLIFQVWPLALLPLFAIRHTSSDKSSGQATVELYKLFKWLSTIVYLGSIAIAAPVFKEAIEKRSFSNDGVHLLFVDSIGLSAGIGGIVIVDRWYAGTSLLKVTDLVHIVKCLILGPGHGTASYFASREGRAQGAKKIR